MTPAQGFEGYGRLSVTRVFREGVMKKVGLQRGLQKTGLIPISGREGQEERRRAEVRTSLGVEGR